MSFSDFIENALLDHLFGKTPYSAPANIFVGLSDADPLDDGASDNPPVGGSYARKQTAPSDWNAATGTTPTYTDNLNAITFVKATGDWGIMTHFTLWDLLSGGNFLGGGALTAAREILNGDTAEFAANTLVARLA